MYLKPPEKKKKQGSNDVSEYLLESYTAAMKNQTTVTSIKTHLIAGTGRGQFYTLGMTDDYKNKAQFLFSAKEKIKTPPALQLGFNLKD